MFNDSIYFAYSHDGEAALRSSGMANSLVAEHSGIIVYRNNLDGRKNISNRNFDVWQKSDLERTLEMVTILI